ncbi:MAG TPA: response regulator [Candidatus Didemnitutus sp.]|jgi:CheY-like chemotaxis protein
MASSISPATEVRPQPTGSSGKCVMLVDDEIAYIDLLEQLLGEHLACPVHCFTRPIEALRALPTLEVGLIVTDYQMPGLDGLEFISEVQRRKAGIPAVMITAYQVKFTDQQMNRVPTLKAVVRKPFKWTALAEHISRYWNGSTPPFPMGNAAE